MEIENQSTTKSKKKLWIFLISVSLLALVIYLTKSEDMISSVKVEAIFPSEHPDFNLGAMGIDPRELEKCQKNGMVFFIIKNNTKKTTLKELGVIISFTKEGHSSPVSFFPDTNNFFHSYNFDLIIQPAQLVFECQPVDNDFPTPFPDLKGFVKAIRVHRYRL